MNRSGNASQYALPHIETLLFSIMLMCWTFQNAWHNNQQRIYTSTYGWEWISWMVILYSSVPIVINIFGANSEIHNLWYTKYTRVQIKLQFFPGRHHTCLNNSVKFIDNCPRPISQSRPLTFPPYLVETHADAVKFSFSNEFGLP